MVNFMLYFQGRDADLNLTPMVLKTLMNISQKRIEIIYLQLLRFVPGSSFVWFVRWLRCMSNFSFWKQLKLDAAWFCLALLYMQLDLPTYYTDRLKIVFRIFTCEFKRIRNMIGHIIISLVLIFRLSEIPRFI